MPRERVLPPGAPHCLVTRGILRRSPIQSAARTNPIVREPTSTLSRVARFRQMLEQPDLEFLMEAHNGLSARIGEETGFNGLWASGLCLSAQFGVRDSNEASWTQVLEMLEFMSDATSLPILLDGDTGYGNFNNVPLDAHRCRPTLR